MRLSAILIVNLLTVILLAKTAPEKGLPFEVDTTEIKLRKIPVGNSLNLEFDLQLPSTQGLNKGAPSFVGVYEKTNKSDWQETSVIDLNQYFTFSDQIHFSKNINLKYSDSEVAIFSTVYHCGKDHKTACYIQGFKGKTTREAKASSQVLPFYIQGKMR